jgi:hypothetical protein
MRGLFLSEKNVNKCFLSHGPLIKTILLYGKIKRSWQLCRDLKTL